MSEAGHQDLVSGERRSVPCRCFQINQEIAESGKWDSSRCNRATPLTVSILVLSDTFANVS